MKQFQQNPINADINVMSKYNTSLYIVSIFNQMYSLNNIWQEVYTQKYYWKKGTQFSDSEIFDLY